MSVPNWDENIVPTVGGSLECLKVTVFRDKTNRTHQLAVCEVKEERLK